MMSYDNGDWYSLTPSRDKLERLEKANACINESLTISVQKLLNAHARGKAKLKQRDEKIYVLQKKMRLLEEQSKVFHEVQSECDLDIFHDTKDNSEKDLILSLQTQLQETVELVVRFADEKYFVSKENESLKDDIKSLQTENNVLKSEESELSKKIDQMKSQVLELSEKLQVSNQEMKQQIILFEEDKRMFLAKNKFLKKVSYSMQKEYNDLIASNDVLRQSLETNFNLLQNDKSLEQMIEIIKKEMGDIVKCFDAEKKEFENEISKLEKENNDLRTSYNVLKEEYEISYAKLEKENNDSKMHYKRLFDSIKQKKVASQVFTKSIPKVNVLDKIYTGESSKLVSIKDQVQGQRFHTRLIKTQVAQKKFKKAFKNVDSSLRVELIPSKIKHANKDQLQVVVLFALAWMDFHELYAPSDLLSIVFGMLWLIKGCVSRCLELSVGEEDLLTLEVPALKNSSYRGPNRRSNSCYDGTDVSAEGETFCS
nr:hypothetical protein [Tanacetum cinerariifolium]